jgi:hypothetical protein
MSAGAGLGTCLATSRRWSFRTGRIAWRLSKRSGWRIAAIAHNQIPRLLKCIAQRQAGA